MSSESEGTLAVRPKLDCHTHIGRADKHVGQAAMSNLSSAWGEPLWDVALQDHRDAMTETDEAVVLAFDAPDIGIVVPNEYVSEYVADDPRLFGFASVDPKRQDAVQRLEAAVQELGLVGLKLGPIYQHFHPHDAHVYDLLEVADHFSIPVLWHQGATFVRDAPLEVARPALLDRLARRFPDLPMIIAHLGHPWCDETMVVVRKHAHVYADLSASFRRPYQFYHALIAAGEYRVMNRILFGSDYPFASVSASVEAVLGANDVIGDSSLPRIPEEDLLAIVQRDAASLLNLARHRPRHEATSASSSGDDD